jgi:hypothetical protein
MTTENEERVRIRTIMGSEAAAQLPQLAEALAFATDLDADAAEAALAAAAMDLAAITAATDQPEPRQGPVAPQQATGLGTPDVVGGDKPSAVAGWKRAIRHGDRGPQGSDTVGGNQPAPYGWSKAKSYHRPAGC